MRPRLAAALLAGALLATALPAQAVDYPGAAWYPASTSNYTASNRESSYDIRWIVIHTAEGSYSGTISWFQNPAAQASSQYVAAKDGRIAQMVLGKDIAWHAGNWAYNTQSIGTEHEGFAYQSATWTDAMYRASAALTRWVADRYGVPLTHPTGVAPANPASGGGIIGHNQVPDPNNPSVGGGAGRHTDPGPYFDWNYYMALVRGDPVDTTPPTSSASLAGSAGSNGWWRSAVTVSLSASDPSGIASLQRRVDLGAWAGYAVPFAVGGEGAHRVDHYAVDGAGNTEAAKTATFSIDSQPPATTAALQGTAGDEGWFRSSVTVTLSATDATSGVAATSATRDGAGFAYGGPFAVAGDGSHALTFRSTDRAGNAEALQSRDVRIDATPPVTALQRTGPSWPGAALYVSSATAFTLAASDAASGVKASAWSWRGAEAGYTGAFALGGADGPGTLARWSRDRAGNVEAPRASSLFLDNTPPSLAVQAPPEDGLVVSLEPVQLGADASDAGSGVAAVEFLVDGAVRATDVAAPFGWAWPAGDEALGQHVLGVRAVDHLGHASMVQRNVTTLPTSVAGVQATVQRGAGLVQGPPALPVVGVVAEADPAAGSARAGLTVDGAFVGVEV